MSHESDPTIAVADKSTGSGGAAWSRQMILAISFALAVIAFYARPLYALATHAAHSDLHSHILLIPLISAYLIYVRREELPAQSRPSFGLAAGAASAALALFAVAYWTRANWSPLSHNDFLGIIAISFVLMLVAGGFYLRGKEWMRAAAFPFAFLVFMIPLPDAVADTLENASKLASAEAANLFFNLCGTPTVRDGTIFQLPGIVIEVAQECSGIRSSWVLFITSVLASNLFLHQTWRRIFLVLFVIPLGIIRNGFRILVIGLLCVEIGPQMIHSVIHRKGGPLFFALSLIPLFLVLWWLRRGEAARGRREALEEARKESISANATVL